MALDFPSSPTDGQEYTSSGTTFVYDSSNARWVRKLNQSAITAQNLSSIASHLLPADNNTYDIGSLSYKFNDLHLSGDTLNIGGAEISVTGGAIKIPNGTLLGDTEIPSGGGGGGTTVVATTNDLPSSPSTGEQAFVTGNGRLYFYNGSGWYGIALTNEAPTFSVEPNENYILTPGGSAETITLAASDPEGFDLTFSGTSSDTNVATVSNVDNVYTVTPTATAGTATITFSATDAAGTITQVSTIVLNGAEGFAASAPAAHPDDIIAAAGAAAVDGWYYIQPSSSDTVVYCYCIFDQANDLGYILMSSTDHSEANTMITHDPSTEDGMVLRSDDSTSVSTLSTIFSSNSYLRVSNTWLTNLQTSGDGTTMDVIIKAIDDTSSADASSWDDMTHDITITGRSNIPSAFGRASLNGTVGLGTGWYLHDRPSAAYGSFHQGFATTSDYHANNSGSHYGHWHRSGVNQGVYAFGDNTYIQEAEWDARFFYFIR